MWRQETVRSVVMHPEPLPSTMLDKGFSSTLEAPSLVISIADESAFEKFEVISKLTELLCSDSDTFQDLRRIRAQPIREPSSDSIC